MKKNNDLKNNNADEADIIDEWFKCLKSLGGI